MAHPIVCIHVCGSRSACIIQLQCVYSEYSMLSDYIHVAGSYLILACTCTINHSGQFELFKVDSQLPRGWNCLGTREGKGPCYGGASMVSQPICILWWSPSSCYGGLLVHAMVSQPRGRNYPKTSMVLLPSGRNHDGLLVRETTEFL